MRRFTVEFIQNYFKEQKCELLSAEYKNVHTKMKYRCKCGNISEIRFKDFKNGVRCMKCSGNQKYTYEKNYYVFN